MNTVILKFCPQCNSQAINQDDNYCEYCGSLYKTVPIRQTNDFSTNLKNQKNFMYYLYNGLLLMLLIILFPFLEQTLSFLIEGIIIVFITFLIGGNVYIHNLLIRTDKTRPLTIIFNVLLAIFFLLVISLPSLQFYTFSGIEYIYPSYDVLILILIIPILFLTGNIFLMNSHNKNNI